MTKPTPGSDEALAIGCTCPVLDNGHGKGSNWGPGKFWINSDCPVHASIKLEKPRAYRNVNDGEAL